MGIILHVIIFCMDNLNENLNDVFELCNKTYDSDLIFNTLKSGSIVEKQTAVLNLTEIRSQNDAEILMENLTGIDGKVRQTVAYKILQLIPYYKDYFHKTEFYEIFAKSIIDIDSNVCRLVIDSIQYLKDNEEFSKFIADKMKDIIYIALDELKKISFKSKKYTSNKQYFKIYWCLETLIGFYTYLTDDVLFDLLSNCIELPEYTIREKCAIILKSVPDNIIFRNLKDILANDENYYVRNV